MSKRKDELKHNDKYERLIDDDIPADVPEDDAQAFEEAHDEVNGKKAKKSANGKTIDGINEYFDEFTDEEAEPQLAEDYENNQESQEGNNEDLSQDGQEPEEQPENPTVPLEEFEKMRDSAEDYRRKWYTVTAEYDNYRKRNQKAVTQAYAEGKADAILKLLPVADTFGYAYDGAKDEKTKAGIDKIIKNFNSIINSLGVEEIAIAPGDEFDEKTAEAIMNVPCEEGEQPNTIKQILKKGYKQGDKVIRYAQVVVCV